jgi:hypothetical protein
MRCQNRRNFLDFSLRSWIVSLKMSLIYHIKSTCHICGQASNWVFVSVLYRCSSNSVHHLCCDPACFITSYQMCHSFSPVREVPVSNLSQDAIYPGFFEIFLSSHKQVRPHPIPCEPFAKIKWILCHQDFWNS